MERRATLTALVLALCGCHGAANAPVQPAHIDREAPEEPAPLPGNGPADVHVAQAPPAPVASGVERIHYALARHVARAELREGDTVVVDLGVPGGAKSTLGGWLT